MECSLWYAARLTQIYDTHRFNRNSREWDATAWCRCHCRYYARECNRRTVSDWPNANCHLEIERTATGDDSGVIQNGHRSANEMCDDQPQLETSRTSCNCNGDTYRGKGGGGQVQQMHRRCVHRQEHNVESSGRTLIWWWQMRYDEFKIERSRRWQWRHHWFEEWKMSKIFGRRPLSEQEQNVSTIPVTTITVSLQRNDAAAPYTRVFAVCEYGDHRSWAIIKIFRAIAKWLRT